MKLDTYEISEAANKLYNIYSYFVFCWRCISLQSS